MRVIIADDSVILRRGLRLLLEATGLVVIADLAGVTDLLDRLELQQPDACVLDVRMPPTHTDEGVAAAEEIRRRWPHVGVLLLSTYAETAWAERLLWSGDGGIGYLLKDRVDTVTVLVDALRRVAEGGTALDPDIVASLVRRRRLAGQLDALTERERAVLELMAQGMSNAGISRTLFVSTKTVETYVAAVFQKLDLARGDADRGHNKRVLAVLAYLQYTG